MSIQRFPKTLQNIDKIAFHHPTNWRVMMASSRPNTLLTRMIDGNKSEAFRQSFISTSTSHALRETWSSNRCTLCDHGATIRWMRWERVFSAGLLIGLQLFVASDFEACKKQVVMQISYRFMHQTSPYIYTGMATSVASQVTNTIIVSIGISSFFGVQSIET